LSAFLLLDRYRCLLLQLVAVWRPLSGLSQTTTNKEKTGWNGYNNNPDSQQIKRRLGEMDTIIILIPTNKEKTGWNGYNNNPDSVLIFKLWKWWTIRRLINTTVKPVLNIPFIKRNFVFNGNIFRSRDYHSIPWLNRKLASAGKCSGPLRFRLR
jgi:hypothetical protein